MLKLPNQDLFKAAINRPRKIKDRRTRKNEDASVADVFYEPGPEDDVFVPPFSTMAQFTKEQRREFRKTQGRARISIEKREPIRRMSKFDEIHTSRQSYFSDATAKFHKMREQQFKSYYHPHHGCYRYGNGRKLSSVYQKTDLLGVSSIAVSRDGKDVVVGYGNGDIKLWDRENQIVMGVEPHDRRGRITRIKYFGDPFLRFLACNSRGEIYLFKLKGLKPPKKEFQDEPTEEVLTRKRQASHGYARSLRMASRYDNIQKPSSAERNKRLETENKIVDNELEKQMRIKPYPFGVATWECYRFGTERSNEIEALDIDPTETKVITAGQDASIRLYDLKTRKVSKLTEYFDLIEKNTSGDVRSRNMSHGRVGAVSMMNFPSQVVTTYYGYNKDCNKTFVRPWNAGTMGGEGHYLRVYAAKFFASKEQLFITGGLDGILKLWDVRCQFSCKNIVGPMVAGDTIDSTDNTIAVGQWAKEGKIMLIDVRTDGYRVLKPLNRWHGGGFPYSLKYFKGAIESGGGLKDDLLLVGGSGYLEVVSINEEEILRGFSDPGHIVSIDNHKNLIFTASTEHAFNLHEYFPNVFHGDSDEDTVDVGRVTSVELKDPEPEVPHARIKDIKKIKRTKAPEDSLIKQIKRLMNKSCRKADLSKEDRAELTKEEEDGEISESSLKNIPLTARKNLKVKAILIDRIADKQMRKLIKKIRKKEMDRKDQKAMKRELLKIQGHIADVDSEESAVVL